MKKRFIILYLLIFISVGELIVRIDKKFFVLNNEPVRINTKIEETAIKTEIDNGNFILDTNQIRILVVGDSYIHGGGIDPKEKFSRKLDEMLKSSNIILNEVNVLDISRPYNNTLDNFNSFSHYKERFKPHVVFWAYNFNDILGGIKLNDSATFNSDISNVSPPKRLPKKLTRLKKFTKSFYASSELSRFISKKIQNELKLKGVVLPIGDFYFLTSKAYQNDKVDWRETIKMLTQVKDWCSLNQAKFIFYKMPEFNLLDVDNLFSQIDKSFDNFISKNEDIIYINGFEDFQTDSRSQFFISKYDGHPNATAHKIIAERIGKLIEKQICIMK